jgi:type IV secretion system protein VirD4
MANVHFVLDEAASLGSMPCIDDAIDKYRGFGIRLFLYYQSLAQLKKCFPVEQDQTVLANVTQVFFGVNDNAAEYISNRLGDRTIIAESGGTGTSYTESSSQPNPQRSSSYSSNTNNNWALMARKLFKPEEILSLNERIAITFVPGVPPICTTLLRYYEKDSAAARLPALRALFQSVLILFIGIFSFVSVFTLLEKSHHGRVVQRTEEYWSRSSR